MILYSHIESLSMELGPPSWKSNLIWFNYVTCFKLPAKCIIYFTAEMNYFSSLFSNCWWNNFLKMFSLFQSGVLLVGLNKKAASEAAKLFEVMINYIGGQTLNIFKDICWSLSREFLEARNPEVLYSAGSRPYPRSTARHWYTHR